ncbi:MAG: glycoside hydrolase family 43 protein [Armatimonadota bacterium]
MHYTNPIIPGFHPDPTICRVGEDFFLATSTFEYFPGIPIFHSRDLAEWRQVGHALTRASQLPLRHSAPSRGIYAPTLRYWDGRFYLIVANHTVGRKILVSADDPAGEWSEPIWLEQEGCDPSLTFDDDGTAYYTSTGPGGICQSVMDITTGKELSEFRTVWGGTGGIHPEGPHLYHIGDWYYLMIAEGGTAYGHGETVARSRSPWGPFESCPYNPILTHRDRPGHPIQATGHADLVDDDHGNWWAVFLGIRPQGGRYHHLGRETFLAPVTWTYDGWPIIGEQGRVELVCSSAASPGALAEGEGASETHISAEETRLPFGMRRYYELDDFDTPDLAFPWNFLRNPYPGNYSLTERPGWLRLHGSVVTLDDLDSPSFVGRRQQHLRCRVEALTDFVPHGEGEEAGLTALANNAHHYDLFITTRVGKAGTGINFRELPKIVPVPVFPHRVAILRRRVKESCEEIAALPLGEGPVTLILEAYPLEYAFSVRVGEGEPQLLASLPTRDLSSEVAGGFTGAYLGLYAVNATADFDWFRYELMADGNC